MVISSLSDEERQKIRAACTLLGSVGTGSSAPIEEDERFTLFYAILSEALRSVVGRRVPPRISYLQKQLQKDVVDGWAAMDDLLIQSIPKPKLRERVRFYQVVIEMTIDYVEELGIPVTMRTVSQQLQNCGSILNRQFPRYLRTGLLPIILRWGRPGSQPDTDME